jgi:hypothetical protein
MQYDTPRLTALTNAINAIQTTMEKNPEHVLDTFITGYPNETVSAYADWE